MQCYAYPAGEFWMKMTRQIIIQIRDENPLRDAIKTNIHCTVKPILRGISYVC